MANALPRVYRAAVRLSTKRPLPSRAQHVPIPSFSTLQDTRTRHDAQLAPPFPVADAASATEPSFVAGVHDALSRRGMARLTLGFPDPGSDFLSALVCSFHARHGHALPITHSASQGWFWDVRPSDGRVIPLQTADHQARSETMADFPWHTDCSYEGAPPRFFGLHVLQHDRAGGGTLSAMNIETLGAALSPAARAALRRDEFRIAIPPEFIKDPARTSIVGSVMAVREAEGGQKTCVMRYRRDLLQPLTAEAEAALAELDGLLEGSAGGEDWAARSTVHLKATDCPAGTIILMDNRRWLHARNHIKDPERHLRRIRWDAIPFP
ncbi:Taurine catabolism dioxygenase [Cordyceps militaris]|uniref:Taurine catabolism dioxygenase n=1 Tax=Cordyceps militaris TaxID=73501 RepID=A0A2H4SFW6_CORMI|nr:Taurine catabolism dioxygenase [Cordyceps militaris]